VLEWKRTPRMGPTREAHTKGPVREGAYLSQTNSSHGALSIVCILTFAADDTHQMTRCCIPKLCTNSGETHCMCLPDGPAALPHLGRVHGLDGLLPWGGGDADEAHDPQKR
jgi:hypothetical protein